MLIINNVSKFKLNLLRDMSVWFYSSFVCTSAYANIYSKTIREINIHRSEVHCGSPFEPGGSGLSFLLHTTCVRSCCTWRASCVVAFIKRIQRYKKTTHTQNTKQDKTKQKNTEAWDGGRISVLRPNPRSRKNVVKVSKWSRSCAEEAHRRLEAGDEATGGGCAGSRTTRPRESASLPAATHGILSPRTSFFAPSITIPLPGLAAARTKVCRPVTKRSDKYGNTFCQWARGLVESNSSLYRGGSRNLIRQKVACICESHVAQWSHAVLRAVHCSVALRQQTIFDAHLLLSAGADFCTLGILWRG